MTEEAEELTMASQNDDDLNLVDAGVDEFVEEEEDAGLGIQDTSRKAYTGNKCTYNMRRMDDPSTAATWNKYKNSASKFVDPSFRHDSNMYFW
jgi:hypothetical protein